MLSKAARHRLILANMGYATALARRYAAGKPSVEAEEMAGEALLELVETTKAFNPAKGDFKSYLNRRVRGAMADRMRRDDTASRDQRKRHKQGGHNVILFQRAFGDAADLESVMRNFPSSPPMQSIHAELSEAIADIRIRYARLPPRHRHVVEEYAKGRILKSIAVDLGVTESRACQILKEARRMLKDG